MYKFQRDEGGTATLEYSLFISLMGLMLVGALQLVGANLFDIFSLVSEEFPSVLLEEDFGR